MHPVNYERRTTVVVSYARAETKLDKVSFLKPVNCPLLREAFVNEAPSGISSAVLSSEDDVLKGSRIKSITMYPLLQQRCLSLMHWDCSKIAVALSHHFRFSLEIFDRAF